MATGTALTGKTGANIFLEYSGAVEIGTPKLVLSRFSPISWTYGTGVNEINLIYNESGSTNNAGVTRDLNTGGGTELDCYGNLLTMDAIKFLYIKNTHATNTLAVFGAGANDLLILRGTTDAVEIPPGGEMYWSAPTAAGVDTTGFINLFLQCKTVDTITYEIVAGGVD